MEGYRNSAAREPTDTGASQALAIVPPDSSSLDPLRPLLASADGYVHDARAQNTRTAYANAWAAFERWTAEKGLVALPATSATVALYLAHLADDGRKVAGIGLALVAISQRHRLAGKESPSKGAAVQETFKGIRRRLGVAQQAKRPLLVADLKAMTAALPGSLLGVRDRALLTLGFAGAFRRSELVALDVTDVSFTADGLEVALRRSKTDQEGTGRKVGIPYGSLRSTCPVRALRAWLEAAVITKGPVFRSVNRWSGVGERLSDKAVALVVKRHAATIGLDAAKFAGHSLRAGLATSAARAGKSERAIMNQTGHRSVTMVRRYIRDASLFSDNAAAGIGL